MSTWAAMLCLTSIYLWGHVQGREDITLQGSRTRIVLAGHDLHLHFTITVPRNTTPGFFECYHESERAVGKYNLKSALERDKEIKVKKEVVLYFNHSSESGEYRCNYRGAVVYLAVLARDEGFKERYHGLQDEVIAPVSTLTVLLLIFSILGSIYIYKSQAAPGGQAAIGGQRGSSIHAARATASQEGDSGAQEGTDEEAAASSVYTTLESRPASIYDVLDPSGSNSRTQSTKNSRKRSNKKDEATSADDGIFESVYENV